MAAVVTLNGESCPLDAANLSEFMAGRGYDSGGKGVAVARNGQVVPRTRWESTELMDGDRLEIVEPVQGG
jgi:sulfur carrier protein